MSKAITTVKYETCDPIFTDNNLDQRNRYKCPECSYLLEDAVQTSCGHWFCHGCADDIFRKSSSPVCPRADCGERLEIEDGKEHFPDKFVRKQIHRYQVRCRYHDNKCPWTGTFIDLLKHLENCSYKQEECPHCYEMIVASEFGDHEKNCPKALVNCPYVQFGCYIKKQMTKAECDKHLEAEVANHLRIVVTSLPTTRRGKYEEDTASPEGSIATTRNFGVPSRFVESDGAGAVPIKEPPLLHSDLECLKKQLASKDSQIRHLQDKLQQVESTVLAKTTENEDRDFRLSLMENSNYDGTMVWKIPQFSQRMEDARTGKYTSIFSLPFYSSRYGYKMCLRLYILGDGIGKGSHMSLFFVLMKGEFDNILQWPFTHKVTFKLINQCGGRDVVDIFQPDPLSSSFQKPKTDMNIASGCPRFVSLNELMQNGFIVEDTVFIKVKVDVTTMKHP